MVSHSVIWTLMILMKSEVIKLNGQILIKKLFTCMLCFCLLATGLFAAGISDVEAAESTTVYFLNSSGWSDIYGYVWNDYGNESLGSWPGTRLESAPEIGPNWYKIQVSLESDFHFISNNNAGTQYDSYISSSYGSVYLVPQADTVYTSAKDAETAMGITSDSGGTNPDLDYDIDLNGTGATLPYTTYEAEDADTNTSPLSKSIKYLSDIQSEASGRQAVILSNTGDYVEFTLTEAANTFVLRYCTPDSSDGTGSVSNLSLYINGTDTGDISLTSKYSWVYGSYPYNNVPDNSSGHRFFDEVRGFFPTGTLSKGTTIKLQKDSSDTAGYYIIDFIECELVDTAGTQPSNSLSVTAYGAVANDGIDDYQAFVNCISDATSLGKEVWIPAGSFDLVSKQPINVSDVTIRGAGMWYTSLNGAGAAFKYQNTCKFYDFSMTGVSTIRDDAGDLAGFEGLGAATNVTIQNIWMEHMKVGIWSYNTTGLVIQGCRIRNTYADGINLCSSTNNSTVRNNNLRNTGDDCIAIWPWQGDSCNNTIAYNTVQIPTLANGIAVYGGSGNVVEYNYVADTINNGSGICIGTNYDTLKEFSGTTIVKNNILERCGSYHCDYSYPIGAIWIWGTKNPMTSTYEITDNALYDCSYEGILFDCWNTVTGIKIKNTNIYGATDGIYIRGNTNCSATFENVGIANYSGSLLNNECSTFVVNQTDKGIYETTIPEIDQKPTITLSDNIVIHGYQISTTLGGSRTIYSVEPEISGKAVIERGLVYGLSPYIDKSDIYVGAASEYICSYAATANGLLSTSFGSQTAASYAMTMTNNIGSTSVAGLEAIYYVRAYAKLEDGSYVYSDISSYSVYRIADYLYQNIKMSLKERHDYLYDNILSIVNSNYTKVDYNWSSSIVKTIVI